MKIKKYALCCYCEKGVKLYYVKKNVKNGFHLKVVHILAMEYQKDFTFTDSELKNPIFKKLNFVREPVDVEI